MKHGHLTLRATRRAFCTQACRTASLLAVGSLAGCGGSPSSPSNIISAPPLPSATATVSARVVSVTIDATSPLASVGSAAIVQTSIGAFLVAHTAQDSFTALTAICTHEACTITGFTNSRFVCPCHGSQFTTNGAVATGPATLPLAQFATQYANGVLTFTA